jgi:hypothetical protein
MAMSGFGVDGNEQQEKDEGLPEGRLTVLNNPIDTKTGKRGRIAHCPGLAESCKLL